MHELLRRLAEGDRRSLGEAKRAVASVIEHPDLLAVLFDGLATNDPVVRMRCADVIEKVSAVHPAWLLPYKTVLLRRHAGATAPEIRWHIAPLLVRLPLSPTEARRVKTLLLEYTQDSSSIVKTMAMQALADLTRDHPGFLGEVRRHIEELTAIGTPAMKARGRKLQTWLARATERQAS